MEKDTNMNTQKSSGFQEDLEYLRHTPLLRRLDYECLKLLAMVSRRIEFTAGDQVFVQGEDDGYAYFIIAGQLQAYYIKDGNNQLIRTYEPGQFIGSLALLGKMPRIFTLQAPDNAETLRLGRDEFQKAVEQFPSSFLKIISCLTTELLTWDRILLEDKGFQIDKDFHALGISLL
ncbi:MAG: cyclic nucleotide-binding domain-containing protein [Desulfobacterales bacterium]|nr:cyclic nucleotide-binding domain-containing protein [Desulfobacterales bacterium]